MSADYSRSEKKSRRPGISTDSASRVPKKKKFDFEKMKAAALSDDSAVRKAEFIEYFERFNEFPSFLFDNQRSIDPRLKATIQDLSVDKNSSQALLNGIKALLCRLPS